MSKSTLAYSHGRITATNCIRVRIADKENPEDLLAISLHLFPAEYTDIISSYIVPVG